MGPGEDERGRLGALPEFEAFSSFGRPVLAAISRKTFIGDLLGREPDDRLAGTLALTAMLVEKGAAVVRSHDVRETADLLRVSAKMRGR